MRIALRLRVFVAVLCLVTVFFASCSAHINTSDIEEEAESVSHSTNQGHYWSPRRIQLLLSSEANADGTLDCCPSQMEMIEPMGGVTQNGTYVDLASTNYRQRFYEHSCRSDIIDRPCRFADRKLHNQTMCKQQYSWVYALVQDNTSLEKAKMDYIKVRSGCACVFVPHTNKQYKNKKRGKKAKRKHDPDLDPLVT